MAVNYRKPVDDEVPWQQRLANYASNPNAGKSEYQRALEVYRAKNAAGDAEGAGAAQTWAGQVRSAVGEDAFNPVKSGIDQLVNRQPDPNLVAMRQALQDRINRPVQQFNYDQNSDPAYQNALRSAQANAATAQNNTLANLRARGQGKSSYSETVANQIQQKEMGKVTSDVLPQLISQAYQRYAGQQQLENQQLGNMFNLANMNDNQDARMYTQLAQALGLQQGYNQQQFTNERTTGRDQRGDFESDRGYNRQLERDTRGDMVQDRAFDRGVLESDRGYDRGVLESDRSYGRGVLESDRSYGLNERQANASIANMGAGNTRADEAAKLAREKFDFEKEQTLNKKNNVDMQEELQGLTSSLRSGDLTPQSALQQLEEDFSLGFYTKPQYDQLKSTISKLAPSYTKEQPITKEQQDSMPSNVQLEKLVPQGVPELDWKSWYKDPKGRLAGVPFEQWQQLYGPRLGR